MQTLKNHRQEKQAFKHRLLFACLLLILLTALLVTRLFYLQILNHHKYTTLSNQNRFVLLPLAPKRGLIYDRHGRLLAENMPVFSLDIRPDKVVNLSKTLQALNTFISISKAEKQNFFKQYHSQRAFESIPLKLKLNETEIARFAVQQYRFPGVSIKARLIRHYPLGKLTAAAVGYVGRISRRDMQKLDLENYASTHYIGKVGIERYYENLLHGKTGFQQVEINAGGHIVRTQRYVPPISGKDLYLTIDSKLQEIAQRALGQEAGAVVAIAPQTGEILALVSNPSFDPNDFVQGLSQKAFHQLQHSKDKPLFNRAIRGQFPLASTIKPFLALEGLDSGKITPNTEIYDPGWFKLPHAKHRYHDLGAHGWVNLHKAITVSCDTFFYKLAVLMGIDEIDSILHRFGFGQATGIDLREELPGLVPSPAWKRKHQGVGWFTGDTVISGIGQGFMLTTPLQLAKATAILANRGKSVMPHLRLKSTDNNKSTEKNTRDTNNIVLEHPETWSQVIHAMQAVIRSPHGTGFRFGRHPAYTVAGKTGTAQLYQVKRRRNRRVYYTPEALPKALRDDSLFIAFAPVDHPKIAIAVIIEHTPDAPKVARQVLDAYLLLNNHAKN